jgi:hypothetical protein
MGLKVNTWEKKDYIHKQKKEIVALLQDNKTKQNKTRVIISIQN